MLGNVSIRQMHIGKYGLGLLVDVKADDTHLSCVSGRLPPPLEFVFLMRTMDEIMACLAQGNQVVGTIASGFARFNVMHVQDRIF